MPSRSQITRGRRAATGRTRITLWERVLMHDIGLVKLFAGGRALFCVPAGMAAGYVVALGFGLPALVGLLLGALPAFLSCFVVVDDRTSRVAARSALLYVPFVLALFTSIALREFRLLELVLIVALLFVQFYAPRFGVWAGDFGAGLFAAYLSGLLLPLPLAAFPSLALVFAASLAATVAIRSLIFHPNAYRSLMRARRAFLSWQTRVLETTVELLEADHPSPKRLRRQRQKAHEAALIAEGLLAAPGAGPTGSAAERLHSLLFDTELTVDALARLADDVVAADAPREVRQGLATAIRVVLDRGGRDGDLAARELLAWAESSPSVRAAGAAATGVEPAGRSEPGAPAPRSWSHAVNRTALLLSDLASSASEWSAVRRDLPTSGDGVPFESPVVLAAGRPTGAAPVLEDELSGGGMTGPWRRVRVSPALRTAIQAAVAVAIAEPLAFLLDGQRFYWGVIGVMVILAGTNSTHDRLRKVASRGVGTVIGGLIGIGLVALLGTDHVWISLAIVVVGLAGGMYGFSRAYVFWVIGLVVVLCQVYAFSGQFSDTLIGYRLVENLLGALVAVGVSLVVLPVATGAMIRRAVLRHLAAVRMFVEAAGASSAAGADATGEGSAHTANEAQDAAAAAAARLRAASRAVDSATFQLEAIFKPLVRFPTGGGSRRDDETRTVLVGVARTLRGIAYRGERNTPLDGQVAASLVAITDRLSRSITALAAAVAGTGGGTWTSSADLIGDLDHLLAATDGDDLLGYRLHGLARVDDALGQLASRWDLTVSGAPRLDLGDRSALLSAGRVRSRFPTG